MTEKSIVMAISGDSEVAGTLSIAAPGALYAVASEPKPKKNPKELLPAAPADRRTRRRLTKTEEEETIIINRQTDPLIPKENLSKQAEPPLSHVSQQRTVDS